MMIQRLNTWTPQAEAGLKAAIGEDKAIIQAEVNQGLAQLHYVEPDTYLVTRVEQFVNGRADLVVIAYQGSRLREVGRRVVATAEHLCLSGIRFHTNRPGLHRLLHGFGFQELERVYHLELAHGP